MAARALLFGGDDTFGCCCAACARDAIVGGSAALRWDERSGTWEHSASPPVAAAVAAAVSTGTGDGRAGYSWGTTVAPARSRICDWSQDSTAYRQLLGSARSILGSSDSSLLRQLDVIFCLGQQDAVCEMETNTFARHALALLEQLRADLTVLASGTDRAVVRLVVVVPAMPTCTWPHGGEVRDAMLRSAQQLAAVGVGAVVAVTVVDCFGLPLKLRYGCDDEEVGGTAGESDARIHCIAACGAALSVELLASALISSAANEIWCLERMWNEIGPTTLMAAAAELQDMVVQADAAATVSAATGAGVARTAAAAAEGTTSAINGDSRRFDMFNFDGMEAFDRLAISHSGGSMSGCGGVAAAVPSSSSGALASLDRSQFISGELEPLWCGHMLRLVEPAAGEEFVDLGCGRGKPGLVAALLYPQLRRVWGVELLEEPLHGGRSLLPLLQQVRRRLSGVGAGQGDEPSLGDAPKGLALQSTAQHCSNAEEDREDRVQPELVAGDILLADWSRADIVFVCGTVFKRPMLDAIAQRALQLRPGARVISLDKRLVVPAAAMVGQARQLRLTFECEVRVSWGDALAFFYEVSETCVFGK
jgi:hypothetical protein